MTWQSLGTVAPSLTEWRAFDGVAPTAAGGAVFRATPKSLGVGVIFKTYALVRFRSTQDGETFYTPSKRVYPREESLLIDAEIPNEVRGEGLIWRPEVKKVVYRNFRGRNPEPTFLIEIEHLVEAVTDPVFVALDEISDQLDSLTNASDFLY
jgi:hypothetical protein